MNESHYAQIHYLTAIRGRYVEGDLIEVRTKRPGGRMNQRFYPASDLPTIALYIEREAKKGDVYAGVAPRTREYGGRDAIERVHVLYVDCDTPQARASLDAFTCRPHMVIASGSGNNAHAYWTLKEPLTPTHAEKANRRLAFALGADSKSTDAPRILRPPGTLNWKHDPPTPVEFVGEPEIRPDVLAREVVGELRDPDQPKVNGRPLATVRPINTNDPLRQIPASVYIPALTGRAVDVDGKVTCPFHKGGNERTPSLHAYDDPALGWTCFGSCDAGGDIFSFGAKLYGLNSRSDFPRIKARLLDDLIAAGRKAA